MYVQAGWHLTARTRASSVGSLPHGAAIGRSASAASRFADSTCRRMAETPLAKPCCLFEIQQRIVARSISSSAGKLGAADCFSTRLGDVGRSDRASLIANRFGVNRRSALRCPALLETPNGRACRAWQCRCRKVRQLTPYLIRPEPQPAIALFATPARVLPVPILRSSEDAAQRHDPLWTSVGYLRGHQAAAAHRAAGHPPAGRDQHGSAGVDAPSRSGLRPTEVPKGPRDPARQVRPQEVHFGTRASTWRKRPTVSTADLICARFCPDWRGR